MKKMKLCICNQTLISRSHTVKKGPIILYDAELDDGTSYKVEKIGQVAVNLTVKFDSKISDPINTVYSGSEVKYVYCNIQNRFLKHTKA